VAKLAKWVLTHSAEQEKALIRRPKSNPSPPHPSWPQGSTWNRHASVWRM